MVPTGLVFLGWGLVYFLGLTVPALYLLARFLNVEEPSRATPLQIVSVGAVAGLLLSGVTGANAVTLALALLVELGLIAWLYKLPLARAFLLWFLALALSGGVTLAFLAIVGWQLQQIPR